jgi:hypothetical protein
MHDALCADLQYRVRFVLYRRVPLTSCATRLRDAAPTHKDLAVYLHNSPFLR